MKPDRAKKRITKKVKKGFQGYPIVTIAYYGPNRNTASKVVVGVIEEENGDPQVRKFFSDQDARIDEGILSSIAEIISDSNARTVTAVDDVIGCPHEEGIDYPEGEECPECEFWRGRDRFTGEYMH